MRRLIVALNVLFICSCSILLSKTYNPIHKDSNPSKFFTYSWRGDEEYLYLVLNIKNFKFSSTYSTGSNQNEALCEITCQPITKSEIEELRFTIVVSNEMAKDKVMCELCCEALPSEQTTSRETYTTIERVTLKNPAIKVDKKATVTIYEKDGKAVVAFKNAFPYSKIKKKKK